MTGSRACHPTRHPRLVVALAFASLVGGAQAAAALTREEATRLLRIAIVTEWVVANCGADDLDGRLLISGFMLKRLEPGELARLRKAFAEEVATEHRTTARGCAVWKGRLIEIQ